MRMKRTSPPSQTLTQPPTPSQRTAAVGTSVGITAFASDADGTDNVTYSALSNDAGGLFTIDPTTGEVTVAGPLDYESATSAPHRGHRHIG